MLYGDIFIILFYFLFLRFFVRTTVLSPRGMRANAVPKVDLHPFFSDATVVSGTSDVVVSGVGAVVSADNSSGVGSGLEPK